MKAKIIFILIYLLPFSLFAAHGDEWTGTCVGVIDGNTIEVLHNGQTETVHLAGIESPGMNQAYGTAAKQFLTARLLGMEVSVTTQGATTAGQTNGEVSIHFENMNQNLVRNGLAWGNTQGSNATLLQSLQEQARTERSGLWQDPNPVPPWVYRLKNTTRNTTQNATGNATRNAAQNQLAKAQRTALFNQLKTAVASGNVEDVKSILQSSHLNVNQSVNDQGWSLLRLAVEKQRIAVAQLLIKSGADVNRRANDGSTALHAAALQNADIVNLLIDHGANKNIADNYGVLPYQQAEKNGNHEAMGMLSVHQSVNNHSIILSSRPNTMLSKLITEQKSIQAKGVRNRQTGNRSKEARANKKQSKNQTETKK